MSGFPTIPKWAQGDFQICPQDIYAYKTQYWVLEAGLELHEPVYVKPSSLARQSLADFLGR